MNAHNALFDKHRIAGLQDGVYSIAMTLLVLELKLPSLPEPLTDYQLWAALLSIWPKVLTWLLSFWVLSVFWMRDVRALSSFNAADRFLLRLSLWNLALVSLLPFSTALMSEHGNLVAASAVYSFHIVALALTQFMRHTYLSRHVELLPSGDDGGGGRSSLQATATLISALAAFGLAFVVPPYNMFALLPMLVLQAHRRVRHRPSRHDPG